jgi:PAS domain S-box-containing protein
METGPAQRVPFRQRLTVRLTGGVILVLLLIGCPFLLAFHRLLHSQQLDALSEATTVLSRVLVDGLRSAMLAGQPHLLDDAVRDLARQEEVERVILLDHRGRVRVSSDPSYEGRTLAREHDDTCRVCHQSAAAPDARRTAVVREDERRIFRAMSAIPNEERCHTCHDAAATTNGILLIDLALGAVDRRFFAGIGSTLALGAVMVVVTIAVLVLLLRRMVHKPLQGVVDASRRVAQGDLDARAGVSSSGEFTLLASQVNLMTDHLARSLRTVENQHRELQEILDSVDDEIIVLDRDRRVVAANRAFQRKFVPSGREIEGQLCPQMTSSSGPCGISAPRGCAVEKVFESGSLHKGIVALGGPDGEEHTVEVHASPLRGPDGNVTHVVEVRRDISERRQLEASLAHSERLASLGLLASGISHEINNPLGAIATSVEGLRRRLPAESGLPPETQAALGDVLARIAREVQRGRDITHRLLKVARQDGQTRTLIDVNQVIEDTLAILAHQIKRSRVDTSLELAKALPPLRGDESRLTQVLMNLVLNAIQAMEKRGGKLRIVTCSLNGAIQINVEDTGCGIAPEALQRIYEPFFTTKPAGKGTGLGLFITHRIVTELGGTIQVRSRPETGTSFKIRIPRSGSEARS